MSVSLNKLVAIAKALEDERIAAGRFTNGRPLTVAPHSGQVATMKAIAARFGRDCRPVEGSHCWQIFDAVPDSVDEHYQTAMPIDVACADRAVRAAWRAAGNRPVSPSEE